MIRIDVRLLSVWLKITKKLIFCIRNKQMVDRWFKLILIKNLNLNCLPCKRKVRKPAFVFRVNNTPNLFIKSRSSGHSLPALAAKMEPSIKSRRVGASAALGLLVEILQRSSLKIPVSLGGLGWKKRSEERTENSGSRFRANFSM